MKKNVALIIVITLLIFCTACTMAEDSEPADISAAETLAPLNEEEIPTPPPSPSIVYETEVVATPGTEEDIVYKSDTITFEYYDVVQNSMVEAKYELGEDVSNDAALNAVNSVLLNDIMGVDALEINKITYSDGNIFIDFKPSIYSLNMGSSEELSILDSIADAYLNNVDAAKAIFYTVDGEPYSSGHIELKENVAYKSN